MSVRSPFATAISRAGNRVPPSSSSPPVQTSVTDIRVAMAPTGTWIGERQKTRRGRRARRDSELQGVLQHHALGPVDLEPLLVNVKTADEDRRGEGAER